MMIVTFVEPDATVPKLGKLHKKITSISLPDGNDNVKTKIKPTWEW